MRLLLAFSQIYEWYLNHKTPFELLGLLLAVAGTVFAVLSIRDGRKLTGDLRSIFDHLTTKQIGAFPVYSQLGFTSLAKRLGAEGQTAPAARPAASRSYLGGSPPPTSSGCR